jgi:lactoylglutathione lyase
MSKVSNSDQVELHRHPAQMFGGQGMRFGYTILYVEDVLRAIDFYERAFGLVRRFVSDDATYGEMETGDTTLSFASHTLVSGFLPAGYRRNDPAEPPAGVEIGFVTDDVPAAWDAALAAGAIVVSPPTTKPWGQTVAYVRDLEGMLVEICTPVAS